MAAANLRISDMDVGSQDLNLGETVSQTFFAGETFTVDINIRNDGTADAGSSTAAAFIKDASGNLIQMDTNSTGVVGAGDTTSNQPLEITIPSNFGPGTYQVAVMTDYDDRIAEPDENDNLQFFYITVVGGEPNLRISDMDVGSQDLDLGETVSQTFFAGETFTVDINIRNDGTADAGSSTAAAFIKDASGNLIQMDTNSTGVVAAGDTTSNQTLEIAIPSNFGPGTYQVPVMTDYDDRIAEPDENDNLQFFYITVAGDTVHEGTDTSANLSGGNWQIGTIDAEPISGDGVTSDLAGGYVDKDWYAVTLAAGRSYVFDAESLSLSTGQVAISLKNSAGNTVTGIYGGGSSNLAEGTAPSFSYTTGSAGGTYYVAVSASDDNDSDFRTATGDFRLRLTDNGASGTDSVPATTSTSASLAVGATAFGQIQQDDVSGDYIDADYFRVTLTGGQRYIFSANAGLDGGDTLDEVFIRLRDAQGRTLSPDIRDESANPDFVFDAPGSGQQTYYLAISAGGDGAWWDDTGAYSVSLTTEGAAPPTNYRPTASATNYIGDPGDTISVTDLFTYSDPDGLSDIVSFAVQDRTSSGGHLTYLGQKMDPNVAYERPIDQIGDWAFVVGPPGTDYVGFNAIDSEDAFNSTVVASVSGAQVQGPQLASAEDLFGQQKLSVMAQFSYAAYVENDGADELRESGWKIVDSTYAASLGISTGLIVGDHFRSGEGAINGRASALLAESPDGNSLVIAFTGTDSKLEWALDWSTATVAHFPLYSQLLQEIDYSNYDKIYVTGHSMGGAMAQAFATANQIRDFELLGLDPISGDALNVEGVVFANPGYNLAPTGLLFPHLDNFANITVSGDAIQGAQALSDNAGDRYVLEDLNDNSDFTPTELHDMGLYLEVASYLDGFRDEIFGNLENSSYDSLFIPVSIGATRYISEPLGSTIYPDRIEPDASTVVFGIPTAPEFSVFVPTTTAGSTPQLQVRSSDFTATNWEVGAAGNRVEVRDPISGETLFYVDDFSAVQFSATRAPINLILQALSGTDILDRTVYFDGGLEADTVDGSASDRRIVATGGAGNDTLIGGFSDDLLAGGAGGDALIGGAGNDTADYSGETEVVYVRLYDGVTDYNGQFAGARGDTLSGIENLIGGSAGDYLLGDAGANRLAGGLGGDYLDGRAGDDVLLGGVGRDRLIGGAGNDRLYGVEGDDVLIGSTGDDSLYGYSGNDVLEGGLGKDRLAGGAGADNYVFGSAGETPFSAGRDVVADWNTGDVIDLSAMDADLAGAGNQGFTFLGMTGVTSAAGAGELRAFHHNGNTFLLGGVDGDGRGDFQIEITGLHTLTTGTLAGLQNVILTDTNAADTIIGTSGDDRLYGVEGNDVLEGGTGKDRLSGGEGADRFVYRAATETPFSAGRDVVADWNTGDVIDLSAMDADLTAAGNQGFTFLGMTAVSSAANAGELRAFQYDGNTYLLGGVDGDGRGDFQIEITGLHTLTTASLAGLQNAILTGTNAADTIIGTSGNDILNAGTGNDRLYGVEGNDVLVG
ncbi:Ca2+-binding RTX toxin-like protein, partial [Constrictibacter sp. MBR-5]|uniref:CARDB domain-containing protein n=1 Tax=Constrictibacter sp. MBR-5 TaxID=3156467 RepID=UPI00339883BD